MWFTFILADDNRKVRVNMNLVRTYVKSGESANSVIEYSQEDGFEVIETPEQIDAMFKRGWN